MRRLSLLSRASLLAGMAVAVPTLFACLDHPLKPVEYDGAQELQKGIQLTVNKDVDILFVIDNSGSMGEEQANVSANFESFINVLEAEDVKANYRIGVTTTDNGNPRCGSTGPEGGKLQMTSCRSRQGEFIFTGTPMVDVTDIACLDNCAIDDLNIQPTTTELDPDLKVRPWLENIDGKTNLPDADGDGAPDYTTVQAFQCFGPQGVAGCGFESHLESMYLAFLHAETEGDNQYGFVRSNAILSVVFVTDEVDCSNNKDFQSIFLTVDQGGNQASLDAFWTDPTAGSPTSAVCWNAGVACTGGPGTYDECHSENYDVEGNAGVDGNQAVLYPVSRYIDFVQEVEDNKREFTPGQEVLVALITGVPPGYESGDVDITYADATNMQEQIDFGIGAGCTNNSTTPVGTARPPVREREFAEAFMVADDRNLFSICANDFSPALESIAEKIRDQIKPACMPACVADTDPVDPGLQPQCNLVQEAPRPGGGIDETPVPQCGAGGAVPDGADVCFIAVTDDTIDAYCSDQGYNLEFRLNRREGVPAPGGTSVKATCQLSVTKEVDCPDL
ncbi:MAG TPA: vWA domain-containing protein [Nannocystaceae bacterium]|nr:vWA domain-containing protein [Nannocystaceae bacterium]